MPVIKVFILLFSFICFGIEAPKDEDSTVFSARVASSEPEAGLIRFRLNFENAKFLTDKDYMSLWRGDYRSRSCMAKMVSRSPDYLLVKVFDYKDCQEALGFNEGSVLNIQSNDLGKNIETAKTLIDVLLKKKLALEGKLSRGKLLIEQQNQRLNALNQRYNVLKDKLEQQRLQEAEGLVAGFQTERDDYQESLLRLQEVQHKLEVYKVKDHNLSQDRWALDPHLYYRR